LLAFGFTFDFADARSPAALPPTPIDEEVPAAPVDVPPVPTVEAEVPPEAALPPLPTVADEEPGEVDAPPVAAPLALWASAAQLNADSTRAVAQLSLNEAIICCSYFFAGST